MNKKTLFKLSILILFMLIFSGCTTPENKETVYVNQYPLSEEIQINNETLLNRYNISSDLQVTFFYSNSTIEDIIDYYSIEENIQGWELNRSKLYAEPESPIVVSYGHVKLKSGDTGAYIFAILNNNTIPIDANVIIGIASGSWQSVLKAGI